MMKKRNLKRRILALVTCTLVLIGTLMLPIGAESTTETTATETPAYTSPVDWSAYPSSNLLPYPYHNFGSNDTFVNNGITYTLEDDGIIILKGQTESENSIAFISLDKIYLEPGIYTLSGSSNPNIYLIGIVNDETQNKTYNVTNTFESKTHCQIDVYIYVEKNTTSVNTTVMPMLNKGDVAKPYQPHLSYYFQQAFDDGYLNGYDDGYDIGQEDGYDIGYEFGHFDGFFNGYNDGYESGQKNGYENGYTEGEEKGYKDGYDNAISEMEEKNKSIFDNATFQYEIKHSKCIFDKITFTPNRLYSSVTFNNLISKIDYQLSNVDPYWDDIDYVNIIISWEKEKTFDYQTLQLYISGDFDVQNGTLTTTDGKSYNLNAAQGTSSNNTRKFEPETTSTSPMIVKSITIRVGRPADLLSAFTLYAPDESYNNGYTNGYKTGYNEAEQGVTHTIYNEGYKEGFAKGKAEGVEIAKTGDWRNLITAVVDVPATVFQNLFNFEILGLDMRVAFGSLMALCVIAIILKFTLLR